MQVMEDEQIYVLNRHKYPEIFDNTVFYGQAMNTSRLLPLLSNSITGQSRGNPFCSLPADKQNRSRVIAGKDMDFVNDCVFLPG